MKAVSKYVVEEATAEEVEKAFECMLSKLEYPEGAPELVEDVFEDAQSEKDDTPKRNIILDHHTIEDKVKVYAQKREKWRKWHVPVGSWVLFFARSYKVARRWHQSPTFSMRRKTLIPTTASFVAAESTGTHCPILNARMAHR